MFPSQGNNGPRGAGGGLDDQNGRSEFAFQTPQPVRQTRAEPTQSAGSSASVARIEELAEQVRVRDAQIAQMQQALRAAGVLPDGAESGSETKEDEAQSRSRQRETVVMKTNGQGSDFKIFMVCKPPSFTGGEDSLACVRWLRKMEQTFRTADFTEEQQVNYAVRMFEGEALEWWDSVDQLLTDATRKALTWETFSKKVRDRFCSTGAMQRAEREFLALRKGDMSIAKYNTTFSEKLQFARDYCPTEEKLIRRYVEGLPFEYRATVRLQSTIAAAMDEARKIEDDLSLRDQATAKVGDKREWEGNKREWEGQSGSSKKSNLQKKDKHHGELAFCWKCHSSHKGLCSNSTTNCRRCGKLGHRLEDCKSAEPICYNCREMGHISRQCPNPKIQMGGDGKKK